MSNRYMINKDGLLEDTAAPGDVGCDHGWPSPDKFQNYIRFDNVTSDFIFDLKPTPKDRDDKLDALQYSLYVGRCNGKTMFDTKLMSKIVKEDKNVDYASSIWKKYIALRDEEERRRLETHFTPKSIEQSADHKTVVVIWTDNTKTIVRLSPKDPDDIYMAFTAALAKKIFRSNSKIKKVIGTHLNEHKKKEKKNNVCDGSEAAD